MFPGNDDRTVVDQRPDEPNRGWSPLVRLLNELQQGWQAGASPRVEPLFQRHPEVFQHPEAGLRLIYEEICQRRAHGEDVSLGELYNRFPQWHNQIEALLHKSEADTIIINTSEDDFFDAFELLHELGRGSGGRVYLARQKRLGNRLVVLKVTRTEDMEHLSLARLQHTNIVPLYGVFDDPQGRRRALCMPYFGSTTLFHIFHTLESIPIARRRGADIIDIIERREREIPESGLQVDLARQALGSMTYVEAICRIGAALADALGDAHRRGLLHLDIKPSNVVISTDGLAMLLDFHLARPPLTKGDPPPHFFGGSPPFMSPEQKATCDDVVAVHPVRFAVDARSEIYSLGMLLIVALADEAPEPGVDPVVHLHKKNPLVSVGLADILAKCVKANPDERYQSAGHVAEDLRRHVQNHLLAHVPNRSLAERWSKWRKRSPMMLPIIVMAGVMAIAILGGSMALRQQLATEQESAESLYLQGRVHLNDKRYADAADAFAKAREIFPNFAGDEALARAIDRDLVYARRSAQRKELRNIVDSIRHLLLADEIDLRALIVIDVNARKGWDSRAMLLDSGGVAVDNRLERDIRRDLTELALDWTDVRTRLAPKGREAEFREQTRQILDEARELSPSKRVIDWQEAVLEGGELPAAAAVDKADAWELYCLARTRMRRLQHAEALDCLERSLRLEPAEFWTNFAAGVCALRLKRPSLAVPAFSVCVGHEPLLDAPYFRRGEAHAALEQWPAALGDFDRALQLRPNLPHVLIERGKAHLGAGSRDLAAADFRAALDQGADRLVVEPLLKHAVAK